MEGVGEGVVALDRIRQQMEQEVRCRLPDQGAGHYALLNHVRAVERMGMGMGLVMVVLWLILGLVLVLLTSSSTSSSSPRSGSTGPAAWCGVVLVVVQAALVGECGASITWMAAGEALAIYVAYLEMGTLDEWSVSASCTWRAAC